MTVYLDSADWDEVCAAARLGFIGGVTTNPSLMRAVTADPLKHTEGLLATSDLPELFYQPSGAYSSLQEEALAAWSLDPERVTLKLPATPSGVSLASSLIDRGARVALTAAQTASSMIAAEAVGCVAVIPYVDRAWRDQRTDSQLVRALAQVRRRGARIIAASVKSVGQLTQAFVDGADAVTAPLAVLEEILNHDAALEAEQAFAEEYRAQRPLEIPVKPVKTTTSA
jgi:transaldolase